MGERLAVDTFSGESDHGLVTGGGVSVGWGLGANAFVGPSVTDVTPLVAPADTAQVNSPASTLEPPPNPVIHSPQFAGFPLSIPSPPPNYETQSAGPAVADAGPPTTNTVYGK